MNTAPFSLTKWYLDCVAEEGGAAIVYCADMRWRGVHSRMASVLRSPREGHAETHSSLGAYALAACAERIAIEHPRLKVRGEWLGTMPPFQQTVYEEPGGAVTWNCAQPGARAAVRVGDREVAGMGYAECVTLTIPPWRLPLKQLWWGRFVSAAHSFAWIDWRGQHAMRLAICDGKACALEAVSEVDVVCDRAALRIEPGAVLRAGTLASTILPGAPGLARMFPKSLFNVVERKWKSRGTLLVEGERSAGWVIHEVVDWPGVN